MHRDAVGSETGILTVISSSRRVMQQARERIDLPSANEIVLGIVMQNDKMKEFVSRKRS